MTSVFATHDRDDATLERVRSALRGLRYGLVNLQVQDGVVVLIERVEKVRLIQGDRSPRSID